ncbi:MAG: MBL fold metallo-hydrolase [Faecousia sp.]
MMFTALASSSHGNAYIVSDKDTRILLECGVSRKKLNELSGFSLSQFAACLVSHEHKDHAKAVQELIKDGITIYMSEGTADALGTDCVSTIASMEQFNVGSLDIVPFSTFHDAAEPLGFLIKSRADGDVLAFATDTVNLRYRFPGLNILAIEANYDKAILEHCEKMPEKVKHRITNCHMEIDTLCDYLRTLDLSACREIHLLHLSDATSHEGHFINKVSRCIPPGIQVTAACRGK